MRTMLESADMLSLQTLFHHMQCQQDGLVAKDTINGLDTMNRGKIWGALQTDEDGVVTFDTVAHFLKSKADKEGLMKMRKYLEYLLKRAKKASGLADSPCSAVDPAGTEASKPHFEEVSTSVPKSAYVHIGTRMKGAPPPTGMKVLFLHGYCNNAEISGTRNSSLHFVTQNGAVDCPAA